MTSFYVIIKNITVFNQNEFCNECCNLVTKNFEESCIMKNETLKDGFVILNIKRKQKKRAWIVSCATSKRTSVSCAWPFPFQLYRTILVPDDRTQKVEYLEIGVYRTTPLMPDRGLVGDNRSSKVFEFATFCSPTQSRRFFFFSLCPRRRRTKFEGYFPPFA